LIPNFRDGPEEGKMGPKGLTVMLATKDTAHQIRCQIVTFTRLHEGNLVPRLFSFACKCLVESHYLHLRNVLIAI